MKKHFIFLVPAFFVAALISKTINSSAYTSTYSFSESSMIVEENAFNTMMSVLTHQRCLNCHPSDHIPKQSEDSHPHYFDLSRGDENQGYEVLKCNTCHQSENNNYSGVPGAPQWSLAPATMNWEGLSKTEIARSLLDRTKNGDRSHEDLIHHLTEDPLVLWAWDPGVDAEGNQREIPPVSKEEFATAVKTWFANGAIIPEEK